MKEFGLEMFVTCCVLCFVFCDALITVEPSRADGTNPVTNPADRAGCHTKPRSRNKHQRAAMSSTTRLPLHSTVHATAESAPTIRAPVRLSHTTWKRETRLGDSVWCEGRESSNELRAVRITAKTGPGVGDYMRGLETWEELRDVCRTDG